MTSCHAPSSTNLQPNNAIHATDFRNPPDLQLWGRRGSGMRKSRVLRLLPLLFLLITSGSTPRPSTSARRAGHRCGMTATRRRMTGRKSNRSRLHELAWRNAKAKLYACRSAFGQHLRFWRRMRGGLGFCEGMGSFDTVTQYDRNVQFTALFSPEQRSLLSPKTKKKRCLVAHLLRRRENDDRWRLVV